MAIQKNRHGYCVTKNYVTRKNKMYVVIMRKVKKTLLRYIIFKLFSFFPSTHINFYIKNVCNVVPPVWLKCHAALLWKFICSKLEPQQWVEFGVKIILHLAWKFKNRLNFCRSLIAVCHLICSFYDRHVARTMGPLLVIPVLYNPAVRTKYGL